MAKVKDYLLLNDSCDTVSKSTISSKHVEQWRSKALLDQWPKLMEKLCADSFRWLPNTYSNRIFTHGSTRPGTEYKLVEFSYPSYSV